MIEPVMFIDIGFLLAALAGLVFVPVVHNRAVRLTLKQLEPDLKKSRAELRVHKDLLAADFAMSTRRAEIMIEGLRAKLAAQLVELGKRSDLINHLRSERVSRHEK